MENQNLYKAFPINVLKYTVSFPSLRQKFKNLLFSAILRVPMEKYSEYFTSLRMSMIRVRVRHEYSLKQQKSTTWSIRYLLLSATYRSFPSAA